MFLAEKNFVIRVVVNKKYILIKIWVCVNVQHLWALQKIYAKKRTSQNLTFVRSYAFLLTKNIRSS